MKHLFKLILLLAIPVICNAQKPPVKFGDISIEDLKMTHYAKDSSAEAVVLADYGETTMEYSQTEGFVLKFERLTRIKILTKDGLGWADFTVRLYHDGSNDEKMNGLKAVTYNLENGKTIQSKLKNDAVFKEKQDANIDIMKMTLPNAKVGSIVEVTYSVRSDFLFNLQDWEFQSTIPVVWSEYRARIPEYFNYEKYMQGYIQLAVNENPTASNSINLVSKERSEGRGGVQTEFSQEKIDFQETRFRWAAKDVPAFKSEPFITTYRDYISKMNFELAYTKFPNSAIKNYMGTWEDINKRYAESSDFGGEVTGNGFLKNKVEEITAGMKTPEEKIASICNYVKQNILWDGTSRKFLTTTIRKVLDEKKGNSAEINLLLASMLEKAGLSAYPVLSSTRDHGFLREEIPVSSQFNYVICAVKVADKFILLDATEKFLPVGVLPERCLNGKGFLVSKEGFQWLALQTPGKSRTIVNADVAMTESGELNGKLTIERTGYYALNERKKFVDKGQEEYVKDFLGNRTWDLAKSEFYNAKELNEPFKVLHQMKVSDHVTSAGDVLYMNPFLLMRMEANEFSLEKRDYPVNFGSPFERMYTCKIKIPDGFQVDELPQSKVFALPEAGGKFLYNVARLENVISITSIFQINRDIFTQVEYPNLREFYNLVVAKQAEQIVLKKKQ